MTRLGLDWRTLAVTIAVAIAVVVGMVAISDGDPGSTPGSGPSRTSTNSMSTLVFAVWGAEEEIAAYQEVIESYNERSEQVDVRLERFPDADSMLEEMHSGDLEPDLYLLPRGELGETMDAERNVPILDLLTEREVPLGDAYAREPQIAFSAADDLQCMPYGASPMMIYLNTDLVDFERMEARGLDVPAETREWWSLEEFRVAAEFASRPRNGTHGVHIEPTLEGLAPFIYSGGGQLFDDEEEPEALALSEGDSVEALRETLEVLRDPRITLGNQQLERRSALEWFRAGKLGMIAGYRDLTPLLRRTPGLSFDVMPMPELGSDTTMGHLTGVCLGQGPAARVGQSADFLVHLISDASMATVAEAGYLVPTNLEVSFSDAFLQPDREPANARAFVEQVNSIMLPPLLDAWGSLEVAVHARLEALLTQPVLEPEQLDAALAEIDEVSRAIIDPEDVQPTDSTPAEPSEPTESPTE